MVLRSLPYSASLAALVLVLAGCVSAPITGRQQLLMVSEEEEIALGMKAFQETTAQSKLSKDPGTTNMVNRVGSKLSRVADKPQYQWQFTVIDEPKTVNAFALPGGKVAVYTGLLPYTRDENGLAFVLGHEIGHVIARHGNERMSQQLLMQLGQQGLNIALAGKSPAAIQAINLGYGIGAQVGVALPFSRAQEYEADHIGITLMAQAGYNPAEAPLVLERMMASHNGQKPLEFLSTHPSDDKRIRDLKALVPQVMHYYQAARKQ